jgi:hypothetical protein
MEYLWVVTEKRLLRDFAIICPDGNRGWVKIVRHGYA